MLLRNILEQHLVHGVRGISMQCPKCQTLVPEKAVMCQKCGYDITTYLALQAMKHELVKLKTDTSTIGLATTFWMRNRLEAQAARNEGDEAFAAYLDENVTHPDNGVALLRRQA